MYDSSAEMKKCDCGKRCESYFRCLYIIVVLVKRPPPEDSPLANGEIEMSHPNYPEKSFTVPLYDTTSEAISSRVNIDLFFLSYIYIVPIPVHI